MIGVFSHDGPISKDVNNVYCATTITEEMLSRYLVVADELVVVTRVKKIDKTYSEANLKPITNKAFKIIEIGNVLSPLGLITKGKYKKTMKNLVQSSSLFFLRMNGVISDMIARECKKQNKAYMVEVGGCAWDAYWNHGSVGKLIAPYMFLNAKKTIKNASFASYVTSTWLQNRYPSYCESITASNVYLSEFDDAVLENRREAFSDFSNKSTYYIGTTANVDVRYKGQEYVIRAIAILKKRGYNCIYELVGGGDKSFLTKLAKKYGVIDNVVFKGVMKHDDIPAWLDHLDIYIQPSKQEGLPRALIEAMSRGCFCLGSTTAGIPELVDPDLLFKASDWKKIAALIEKVIVENDFSRIIDSYNKSKKYDLNILNNRRNDFYQKYKDSVEKI